MRLLVSCIPYDGGKSGISVYVREVVAALAAQGHSLTLLVEPGEEKSFAFATIANRQPTTCPTTLNPQLSTLNPQPVPPPLGQGVPFAACCGIFSSCRFGSGGIGPSSMGSSSARRTGACARGIRCRPSPPSMILPTFTFRASIRVCGCSTLRTSSRSSRSGRSTLSR